MVIKTYTIYLHTMMNDDRRLTRQRSKMDGEEISVSVDRERSVVMKIQ